MRYRLQAFLIVLLLLVGCAAPGGDAVEPADLRDAQVQEKEEELVFSQNPVSKRDYIASDMLVEQDGWLLVSSLEDLLLVAESVNSNAVFADGTEAAQAQYRLTADIDFADYGGQWEPIGSRREREISFSGTFDGDGRTIRNFTLHNEDSDLLFAGLFGYIDKAAIRNVNLIDCDVSGSHWTGGLAGGVWNTWGSDFAEVTGCHVSGRVAGGGEGNTGGVVGVCVLVQDCSFAGEVSIRGSQYHVGGVAGLVHGIYSCRSDATVNGVSSVGGVVGRAEITQYCYALGDTYGKSTVGGVAGESCVVESCYNAGSVIATSSVGGIVGESNSHHNTLEGKIGSSLKHLLMMGESIQGDYGSRICPNIHNAGAVEAVYSRRNLLVNFSLGGGDRENGRNFPEELLSDPKDMEKILCLEGEQWTDHWQPVQAGYLPQLLWEDSDPIPVPTDWGVSKMQADS